MHSHVFIPQTDGMKGLRRFFLPTLAKLMHQIDDGCPF